MRLWNYIDNAVDAEEKMRIEALLENNLQWQEVYNQLLEMHQLVKNEIELEEPSMRFTKNVMEEISKAKVAPATNSYINKNIIGVITWFFIVLIGGFVLYMFTELNWSSTANNDQLPDFSKFDISKYFSKEFVQIFLMINVVLALVLFDRILARKRNASKHKHG